MSPPGSLCRLVLSVSLASLLSASGAFADPAGEGSEEQLLEPGTHASSEVMELQAAGPPQADDWSDGALEAARTNLSTSTTGGSAVGAVKIDGGRYNLYQENAPVPHSTYTPPPLYP